MAMNNQQLIRTNVDLERQLHELKIERQHNDNEVKKDYFDAIEIGEEVVILNFKKGQHKTGLVVKIHQQTKRATIVTTNKRSGKEKVVQLLTNIKRKE